MTIRVRRRLPAVVAASALLLVPAAPQAEAAKAPTAKLKALVKKTKGLPEKAAKEKHDRGLARAATHAAKSAKKKPCTAVKDLERYRKVLAKVKVKQGKRHQRAAAKVAALGPLSMQASQKLLADRRTRRCGGGVKPSTADEVETTVTESTENTLSVHVELPELRFAPETGGGQAWTKLSSPNTDTPAQPGTPGIPTLNSPFGVPEGAELDVEIGEVTSYRVGGVDVFPAQPDPVDGLTPPPDFDEGPFATPPFQIDKRAYNQQGLEPAQPADAFIAGGLRDVTAGGLSVPAAQYSAASGNLKVIKSVDVKIDFVGGTHQFSDELGSPWERPQRRVVSSFLNNNVLKPFGDLLYRPRRCGEEMLVITNPATLPAANTFANAKRAQGMRTSVFQTGAAPTGIGSTAAEIQTFIRSRLDAFLCVRPSYVTILGDDDLVPTFPGINGIPSDLQYSMQTDADELPDVAVGRIIGNDLTAVNNAISKIVNYETTPPTGPMLSRATIAAQFQDDNLDGQENRTFIQFAETVRNGLVNRGVAVDRIYDDSPTVDPLRFNDGTSLPDELKKPTFAWNGTGADVSNAWNDGRFLVIHRDHGWSDGWGHPGYNTANVQALTNGSNLPVIMSINCSSAAYDYDETSFVGEGLVKANGGHVGAFGDTRDSPTWHNTQIGLGFVDGLLPSVLGGEGPTLKQRTGDALINGKLRLAGLSPPATDGNTRNELYLWHYFGDPSMQMWGGGTPPFVVDVGQIRAVFLREFQPLPGPGPDPPPYIVHVEQLPPELNGQPISLLRDEQVIGKANVANGQADIPADFGDSQPTPGSLFVAAEGDGAVPFRVPVGDVPQKTTLTQDCEDADVPHGGTMQTTGTLSPAAAGKQIIVRYTAPPSDAHPNGETFERTVTTNADGTWSDTINPGTDSLGDPRDGTWTIQARFAGDANNYPSTAPACEVVVFDNS